VAAPCIGAVYAVLIALGALASFLPSDALAFGLVTCSIHRADNLSQGCECCDRPGSLLAAMIRAISVQSVVMPVRIDLDTIV
jgi:hypothetical protein